MRKAAPPFRVAITGIGLVTPTGLSLGEWRDGQGRHRVTAPDGAGVDPVDGWQVLPLHGFDPRAHFERGFKYWIPATQYLVAAAQQAVTDARLTSCDYGPQDVGIVVGTNFSVYRTIEEFNLTIRSAGAHELSPMIAPNFCMNIPPSVLSIRFGFRAFDITLGTAVIAGLQAIDVAVDALRRGRARAVLVGAVEGSPPRWRDARPHRPVLGGGGCVLIVEPLALAVERHAVIRGEIGRRWSRFIVSGSWTGYDQVLACEILRQMIAASAHARENMVVWTVPPPGMGSETFLGVWRGVGPGARAPSVEWRSSEVEGFTLSPMLALASMLLAGRRGVIVAASHEGHLALLEVLTAAQRLQREEVSRATTVA